MHKLNYELVSTGGSAKALEAAGLQVTRVEALTGFPEMLDGVESESLRLAIFNRQPIFGSTSAKGVLLSIGI